MSALTEFKSYSQAGQDAWVYSLFPPGHKGTFLDIGCSHPIEINNTYALERMGWNGLLLDVDDVGDLVSKTRSSTFIHADATKFGWDAYTDYTNPIDYLSMDVDGATFDALRNIPFDRQRFNALTVEHDRYRFGPEIAAKIRAHLILFGYRIERLDVTNDGLPFEDWWLHESFTPYMP